MNAPKPLPLTALVSTLAAIDKALDDDRAHRVTLLKPTYFALSAAGGVLEQYLRSIDVQVPVATE